MGAVSEANCVGRENWMKGGGGIKAVEGAR